jgi:predicted N-formylglutamate amidohydrolase
MTKLLHPDDPPPVGVENEAGASPILFASDHAGRAIPKRLGTLGLDETERARHIAYDIGIYGVTSDLARDLDATYVFQPYSRLVIDCNRKPGSPHSIMRHSDGTTIPANIDLSADEARAREEEILRPYHAQIERIVAARRASGRPTILFAMHSCTPLFGGESGPRPWQIMVMADKDWRVGDALIDVLRAETDFTIGINEPYTVSVENDYTIPVHAEAGGLPYIEIEIRQDLIGDRDGQRKWSRLLSRLIPRAVDRSGVLTA